MNVSERHHRGKMAFHAGMAAEYSIAQDYERRGFVVANRRWRGKSGEIDLILRYGKGLIFVEVKQALDFNRAVESLSERQMQRIYQSAEEFLDQEPNGSLTDVRFDVPWLTAKDKRKLLRTPLATADPLNMGHCIW
jgi:putative endonuclease